MGLSNLFENKIASIAKLLHKYQNEGNSPIFDSEKFVEMIEAQEPSLKGFFNFLFQAMNPSGKNPQTQKSLQQKVMMLCYQLASLRNKQVSSTKTTIGLFLLGSRASVVCINTLVNMGICSTYQTVYNELKKIAAEHKINVENYVKDYVSIIKLISILLIINDYLSLILTSTLVHKFNNWLH